MQSADIESFLHEPMRMAQVASVSPAGNPLLGSLWFLFDGDRFWFSSHPSSPLVQAINRNKPVAVIIDDFNPDQHIRQVRIRGTALTHPHDAAQVNRIYARYLGNDRNTWPDFFQQRTNDPGWALWSVAPESGVAAVYPEFRADEMRWQTLGDCPFTGRLQR